MKTIDHKDLEDVNGGIAEAMTGATQAAGATAGSSLLGSMGSSLASGFGGGLGSGIASLLTTGVASLFGRRQNRQGLTQMANTGQVARAQVPGASESEGCGGSGVEVTVRIG